MHSTTLAASVRPRAILRRLLLAGVLLAGGSVQADVLFDENFDYPDGNLVANSAGLWTNVSGATPLTVTNGKADLSFTKAEDVARSIGGNYSSGALYYSALLTMTAIPGTSQFGAYMMHLSDTDGGIDTDFFARLYVNAVDTDTYVFGVRNRSLQSSPSDYPTVFATDQPIDLNIQVAIVVKFDFATLESTLWVNPLNENSPSVRDTFDVTFAGADQTLSRMSMRQAAGVGTSAIERLKVGTTFAETALTVPEPGTGLLLSLGACLGAFPRRRKAGL